MIIYFDEDQNLWADYYDSEGRVLRYAGQVSEADRVVFTSIPAPSGPSFRLSYHLEADGKLTGTFEVTSPTQPDTFVSYLNWSAIKSS